MDEFADTRGKLSAWLFWFAIGNTILYSLIGIRYLQTLSFTQIAPNIPSNLSLLGPLALLLVISFLMTAYLALFSLLAFFPMLLLMPIINILPKPRCIIPLGIIFSTCIAVLLIVDSTVFAQYRFHLNGIILQLLINQAATQIFDFTWLEWTLLTLAGISLLGIESYLANFLWRKITLPCLSRLRNKLMLIIPINLFLSCQLFITGLLIYPTRQVPETARILPLYTQLMDFVLPSAYGEQFTRLLSLSNFAQPQQANRKLHYPIQSLQCSPVQTPLNLVVILIDTWRFDMLNPTVSPHLYQFAQSAWQFTKHWSGGNSTQPGLFSLFYSLPNTYWTAMLMQQRSPVLIDELLKQHYQTGIYASASLSLPAFNKTIFRSIPHLQVHTPGNTAVERDQAITKRFLQFLTQVQTPAHAKQPFFGFLFYDTAHSFCNSNVPKYPFQPATQVCNRFFDLGNNVNPLPYLNRYKNAVYYIDGLANQVLTALAQQDLLKNTVVIITGDHGNEFNDNHLNYWGHASNFTRYQVQTPLIIYWPGQKPQQIHQQTSHYDLAPTLLTHMLGCNNPASDYSLGRDLLKESPLSLAPLIDLKYLIISSYIDTGIIEPDRIDTISPTGAIEVTDLHNRSIPNAHPRLDIIQAAFGDIHKFYAAP